MEVQLNFKDRYKWTQNSLFLFLLNEPFVISLPLLLVLLLRLLFLLLLDVSQVFFRFFLLIRFLTGFLLIRSQRLYQEVVTTCLLFLILLRMMLVDTSPEVVGVTSERDIHHLKEPVHSANHAFRGSALRFLGWYAAEHDDLVCEVSRHDEIVLYNEGSLLLRHNPALHDSCSQNTLFRIKVRRWLVDQVEITWLCKGKY